MEDVSTRGNDVPFSPLASASSIHRSTRAQLEARESFLSISRTHPSLGYLKVDKAAQEAHYLNLSIVIFHAVNFSFKCYVPGGFRGAVSLLLDQSEVKSPGSISIGVRNSNVCL